MTGVPNMAGEPASTDRSDASVLARRASKRALDVAGAVGGLVVLAPLIGVVALAVRLTMGKPVLWRHVRPGRDGVPFEMIKFRTMTTPEPGEMWLRTDADRLTRLGRALRKSSVDEIPGLWNVLKGEMSLVGPRPLLHEYLSRYTPEQARRHEVRPGITGWAQVNGRQGITFSKRLVLDTWYVDHQTLVLDLKIIGMTLRQAASGSGVISGQDIDDVDDLGPVRLDERHNGAR